MSSEKKKDTKKVVANKKAKKPATKKKTVVKNVVDTKKPAAKKTVKKQTKEPATKIEKKETNLKKEELPVPKKRSKRFVLNVIAVIVLIAALIFCIAEATKVSKMQKTSDANRQDVAILGTLDAQSGTIKLPNGWYPAKGCGIYYEQSKGVLKQRMYLNFIPMENISYEEYAELIKGSFDEDIANGIERSYKEYNDGKSMQFDCHEKLNNEDDIVIYISQVDKGTLYVETYGVDETMTLNILESIDYVSNADEQIQYETNVSDNTQPSEETKNQSEEQAYKIVDTGNTGE